MKCELLTIYSKIISQINGALTLETIYEAVLKDTLAFIACNRGPVSGSIILFSRATQTFETKASVQTEEASGQEDVPCSQFEQQLMQTVIDSSELINVADVTQEARWATFADKGLPRAYLCVPIMVESRIFGTITIQSHNLEVFTPEEEQLLIFVGEQLALAIETYTLRDLGNELTNLSFEDILTTIAQKASLLFAARSSAILLIDNKEGEESQGARYPASDGEIHLSPRPDGLTNEVVELGTAKDFRNIQNDPLIKPTTRVRGIQSVFGVPLQMPIHHHESNEMQTIGALFVDMLVDRASTEREQMVLRNLARQAAIAIENKRHTHALDELNKISLEIASSTQAVPGLAETILNHAIRLVDATGGRLCLLDDTGREVRLAFMKTPADQILRIGMQVTGGVFGRIVATKKPFAKYNYQDWEERNTELEAYGFRAEAVAGVPIIYQGHLWGAILVHEDRPGRVFDQNELDILTNLGNLAAVAFSNASRLNDLERLIESAYVSVIAVDASGYITQFNRRAEELLQYTKEEAIGMPITDIYYFDEGASQIQKMMLEREGGRVRNVTTHLRSKKGLKIPIKISASLLFDYEGKRSGSVGFFQDQRRDQAKTTMAGLLVKEELFQGIVDQAWEITGASHSAHLALNVEQKLQVKAARPTERFPDTERAPVDLGNGERIGISGRAYQARESQLVPDVTDDPDYICYDPETRSELAVPIIDQREDVLGVIDVQHPDVGAFNKVDQRNLETLAEFAVIAIQNAQLYHQSRVEKRRFEVVANIISEAARNVPINDLLRSTCHRLETIFAEKEATASIRLYEKENNILRFEPEWHENFHHQLADEARTTQRLDQGICGWVARTRLSKNVGNVDEDEFFMPLVPTTRSELATPIHRDKASELIGVLDLQSPQPQAFNQNDLEFLEILARHLVTDIEKAQLTKEANAQRAFRRIGEAVTQPQGLQETLDKIVAQIYRLDQNRQKEINSVILRERQGSKLRLVAAEPRAIRINLEEHLLEVDLDKGIDGKIGISGRAVLSGETQLVSDVTKDPDYRALHSTTKSELTIPIKFNDVVVAVVDIESAASNAFDAEDRKIYEALAAQVGIALNLSYRLDDSARRNRHLKAIYKASRLVREGIVKTQSELLQEILEQAVEQIQVVGGNQATLGVIQLYDEEKNELVRESIYPPSARQEWEETLGEHRSLVRTRDHQIGINGRAVLEKKTQRVDDVNGDRDYVGLRSNTRAELDVPLIDEDGKVLGVIGLESEIPSAFGWEDQQVLEGLAELAVIAIRNVQQYQALQETNQELENTRARMAVRTAVAWLGTERASWQHKIVGHISTIENIVTLFKGDLKKGASEAQYQERIDSLERVIAKTREHKIAQPLSNHEGIEDICLDEFIQQWYEKFHWGPDRLSQTTFAPHLNCPGVYIAVNPSWFSLVLENVVNNALKAMDEAEVQELTITTALVQDQAEITIADTGPGIPIELRDKMFKEFIPRERGSRGEGIGQVLSTMIVETYNGTIEVQETGPSGTSIAIRLPYKKLGHGYG